MRIASYVVLCMVAGVAVSAYASEGLSVTDGLRFHVDANVGLTVGEGNRVSCWADQSGSGLNVVQSTGSLQPMVRDTQHGPGVYFNSTNIMATTDNGICYANHTVIAVAQPGRIDGGDFIGSNKNGGYGSGDILLQVNYDGGRILRAAMWGSKNHFVRTQDKDRSTDLVILEQRFDGSVLEARVNGSFLSVADGQECTDFSDFPSDVNTGVLLGGRSTVQAGKRFLGDMFEVLVYDRAITPQERRSIILHLAEKWGVPGCSTNRTIAAKDDLRFRMSAAETGSFQTNEAGRVLSYADSFGGVGLALLESVTTGNRPILTEADGLPAMRFYGTNHIATTTSAIDYGAHDIFLVVKPATDVKVGDLFFSKPFGGYDNGDVLAMCNYADSALTAAVYAGGANHTCKSTSPKTVERVILEQRFDGSTLFASVNGRYEMSAAGIPAFSKLGGVNLGGRPNMAAQRALYNGDIHEVRVYDKCLTSDERRTALLEMSSEWGVEDDYLQSLRLADDYRAECPVLDGLVFRCDATKADSIGKDESGVVSSWLDLSGEGNFVSQSMAGCRPVYLPDGFFGDRPGVSFDGSKSLYGGTVCYSNSTVFVVAQPAAEGSNEDLFSSYSGQSGVVAGGVLVLANIYGHTMRGTYAYTGSSYQSTADSSFGASRTVPTIYELRVTDSKLEASALSRKTEKETVSADHTASPVSAKTSISLGGRGNSASTTTNFKGVYAEVLVYERALSDAEVSTVEAYLTNKWFDKPCGFILILR